jgi:uncharacterized protein
MGFHLNSEPQLLSPDLIVGWPGIGNVGLMAVETLRRQLEAEYLGEIDPEPFFYPSGVVIKAGVLESLSFPGSRFYFKKLPQRDLILFIGDEQPTETGSTYASGGKAYEMANLVLDVAQKFGCRRVFTSGAAVSAIHHNYTPGVWAVGSNAALLDEINGLRGNRFRSELQGKSAQASISGLNGLLIGVAANRGLPAACLMGEVPDYLARAPMPYPAATRSVLDLISRFYDMTIDFGELDDMRRQMSDMVDQFFSQFPDELKDKISQRAQVRAESEEGEAITDEDKKWMAEHVEDLFRPAEGGGDRAA